jgi:hypothetical protein
MRMACLTWSSSLGREGCSVTSDRVLVEIVTKY